LTILKVRLRRYVVYVAEFLASDDGVIMARVVTGIHDDKKLQGVFLERYVMPRRQMQRRFVGEAIASGQLKWVMVAGTRSVR